MRFAGTPTPEGDGEDALAAAQRLVGLDATREDRQRAALKLFARYKGRDAALSHAKLLTDLLRGELGVAPEAATRALIDAIKRGEFDPRGAGAPDLPTVRPDQRCQTGRRASRGSGCAA